MRPLARYKRLNTEHLPTRHTWLSNCNKQCNNKHICTIDTNINHSLSTRTAAYFDHNKISIIDNEVYLIDKGLCSLTFVWLTALPIRIELKPQTIHGPDHATKHSSWPGPQGQRNVTKYFWGVEVVKVAGMCCLGRRLNWKVLRETLYTSWYTA